MKLYLKNLLKSKELYLFLPSVIMVIVFVGQVLAFEFLNTSSWYRGGFGMFATIDKGANSRTVQLILALKDRMLLVPLPNPAKSAAFLLKHEPSEKNLQRFGSLLEEYFTGEEGKEKLFNDHNVTPEEIKGVLIQVFRIRFDQEKTTVGLSKLTEHLYAFGSF